MMDMEQSRAFVLFWLYSSSWSHAYLASIRVLGINRWLRLFSSSLTLGAAMLTWLAAVSHAIAGG